MSVVGVLRQTMQLISSQQKCIILPLNTVAYQVAPQNMREVWAPAFGKLSGVGRRLPMADTVAAPASLPDKMKTGDGEQSRAIAVIGVITGRIPHRMRQRVDVRCSCLANSVSPYAGARACGQLLIAIKFRKVRTVRKRFSPGNVGFRRLHTGRRRVGGDYGHPVIIPRA